jgi:hypothetical protein
MPRKKIVELINELRSSLPDYRGSHYPTSFYRILASLPGGDELVDMGYERLPDIGWREADQIARTLVAIESHRDLEDLIAGLTSEEEILDEESGVGEMSESPRGVPANKDAAHELALFTTNDGDIYRRHVQSTIKALARKIRNGTYNADLAVNAWAYVADAGAQKYTKEFGGSGNGSYGSFSKADRMAAAKEIGDYYDEEVREAAGPDRRLNEAPRRTLRPLPAGRLPGQRKRR